MADRFSGFARRGPRVQPIEARGFEDRAAVLVAVSAGVLLIVAELALVAGGLVAGTVAAAGALVGLVLLAVARGDRPEGRLCVALSVVPVLLLAGVALPAVIIPEYAWYAQIGIPVFLAIALAARVLGLRPADLGFRRTPATDVAILAGAGVPLGLAAFVIAEPDPLPAGISWLEVMFLSIAIVLFAALLEEVLLRGLVQRVATELVGDGAVAVSVGLTALLYLASLNLRYVVLMTAIAILFGMVARRTGSIAGTTAGHAVLLWTQLILWPMVLR